MKALNEECAQNGDLILQTKQCLYVTDNTKPREKIGNAKAGIKDHGEICPAVSIALSLDEYIDSELFLDNTPLKRA